MTFDPLTVRLVTEAAATYAPTAVPSLLSGDGTDHLFSSIVNGISCFSFEGTQSPEEWMIDFLAIEVPAHNHPEFGPVHLGFYLDTLPAVDFIFTTIAALGWPPFYVDGHSKGASQALLAHALLKARGHPPLATRAYEPARVGGPRFVDYLKGEDIQWTQTYNTHGPDIVTMVAPGVLWASLGAPVRLAVPDGADMATKHCIPAVGLALGVPGLIG